MPLPHVQLQHQLHCSPGALLSFYPGSSVTFSQHLGNRAPKATDKYSGNGDSRKEWGGKVKKPVLCVGREGG